MSSERQQNRQRGTNERRLLGGRTGERRHHGRAVVGQQEGRMIAYLIIGAACVALFAAWWLFIEWCSL